ncbi:MAG: hypothetical protein AAFN77_09400 [Planctomycetota bacterium]
MGRIIRFGFALAVAVWSISGDSLVGQNEPDETPDRKAERFELKGTVVAKQKYSVTVATKEKEYRVRLGENASVALLMNKPFFDWKANRVYVEIPGSATQTSTSKKPERVGYAFPAEQLFLIAKFRNAAQMKRIMATKEKRINLYLISPTDLGNHEPTEDELYISGKLTVGKNDRAISLETDQQTHRVRLGFRTATMNGFSIAELKPNKTRITLTGVKDEVTGDIIASRLAFEPIEK